MGTGPTSVTAGRSRSWGRARVFRTSRGRFYWCRTFSHIVLLRSHLCAVKGRSSREIPWHWPEKARPRSVWKSPGRTGTPVVSHSSASTGRLKTTTKVRRTLESKDEKSGAGVRPQAAANESRDRREGDGVCDEYFQRWVRQRCLVGGRRPRSTFR